MSTTKTQKKAKRNAAKAQLSLATRKSLAAKAAPPLTPMMLPMAEELMVFRRVHLPALARQGGPIPQPLTDLVGTLFDKGSKAVIEEHGPDKHDQLAAALIRATAVQVPETDEILAALAAAQAVLEDESWKDEEMELVQLRAIETAADELVAGEEGVSDLRKALALVARRARTKLVGATIAERRQERGAEAMGLIEDALAKLDAGELQPLFVKPGEKPDEGQQVLALGPDDAEGYDPEEVVMLHPRDLRDAMVHIYRSGPYAHRQFRR